MTKSRVAVVTNFPAPYRLTLFNRLATSSEFEFHFFFWARSLPERNWEVPYLEFPHTFLPSLNVRLRHRSVMVSSGLLKALYHFRADCVIVGGSSLSAVECLMYCIAFHKPLIIWWGGTPSSESSRSPIVHMWRRFLLKRATGALAYGPQAKENLISYGMMESLVTVCGNLTLDPVAFAQEVRSHSRQAMALKADLALKGPIVLAIGQLVERKNYLTLLRAYAEAVDRVPEIGLVLVGDGPQRYQLQQFADENGLRNVRIIGSLAYEKIPAFYALADVFIHPACIDQWPQVVNEALAAGLPVIASTTSGLPEALIEPGRNGFWISPDDCEAQVSKLVEIILLPYSARQEMGHKSYEIAKRFGCESVASAFLQTAQKALMLWATGTASVQ